MSEWSLSALPPGLLVAAALPDLSPDTLLAAFSLDALFDALSVATLLATSVFVISTTVATTGLTTVFVTAAEPTLARAVNTELAAEVTAAVAAEVTAVLLDFVEVRGVFGPAAIRGTFYWRC
jgi:hypothetical protein